MFVLKLISFCVCLFQKKDFTLLFSFKFKILNLEILVLFCFYRLRNFNLT